MDREVSSVMRRRAGGVLVRHAAIAVHTTIELTDRARTGGLSCAHLDESRVRSQVASAAEGTKPGR